jgi:phage terminase large subunit GpA-like protein
MRLTTTAINSFLDEVWAGSQAAWPPTPIMSVPEWADTYRHLSTQVGAIGGPWRTERVEVARGPMMAATEHGVKTVTAMTCTQLLKTSLIENIVGRAAHIDPGPILLCQPKDEAVKKFSKERIAPMARVTPVLRDLLGNDRERGGSDTLGYKEFPGGFLAMESAGSPTNLAMRPIRITLLDEIDKYETTKEGDPVTLAEERTSTFDKINSLHVRCCSPTLTETSRIHRSYYEGDQRRAFVACPHCGYEQALDFFKHVHWEKTEDGEHLPLTAAIHCTECGEPWTESQRMKIMTTKHAVKWRQTREFECCGEKQKPLETRHWTQWTEESQVGYALCRQCNKRTVSNTHASFNASKLYSPFTTIAELAAKWIIAKDDPETKQTFYNTQLGLAFSSELINRADPTGLLARCEVFNAEVPFGTMLLTAGVDVQAGSEGGAVGRLEVEVVGWGAGYESWSVVHEVIPGDPSRPETWARLDELLLRPFKHESGREMFIRAVCVDSGGHNTEEVYKFARARVGRNVWAIKGASDKTQTWSPVWPIPKLDVKKSKHTGYRPQIIGVNAGKLFVRNKLAVEEPGPGYSHFPVGRPAAWFEQLTAEDLIVETKAGAKIRRWLLKRGRANEALDCRVYAYAAVCGLEHLGKINWAKLSEFFDTIAPPPPRDVAETAERLAEVLAAPEELVPPPPRPAPPPAIKRVRPSAWLR